MKKYIFLLSIVVIILAFPCFASAEKTPEDYILEFKSILPEESSGIVENSDVLLSRFSIKGLLKEIASAVSDEGSDVVAFALTLLGLVTISALASNCHESFRAQTEAAVGVIASLSVFPTVNEAFSSISASLSALGEFFTALTPITVGMTALGGGNATAGVQAGGMYTALTIVGGVGSRLFLALSSFGLAIASTSALGNKSASAVGKGIKGLFNWAIGIFTTTITAIFSLQTLVASAADSAAMRTAKYMATGLIPVVGSAVSGALATLASGLTYAKSLVGGGAIAVLVSMALSPLIMLLIYRLVFTAAISISTLVGAESCANSFTAYRFAFDMTISAYVLSVILYLFQIILFIKVGVALQ